jgi:beta-mannosidase
MLSWFQLPASFEMLLWVSQILQGMAMKYAVEHWRRSMPRGMGTLYWQINDCWPVASWSSIDYPGNWKALHYMARDFFAPLLVSAIEDPNEGSAEVHVTSDFFHPISGDLRWTLTDTTGNRLAENSLRCSKIAPSADTKVCLLQFKDHLAEGGGRRLLLWLELLVENEMVSQNLVTFIRPKHLELRDPELTAYVRAEEDGSFIATVGALHPALWVWLDLSGIRAKYSQRFFHLRPGKPIDVRIVPEAEMTLETFEENLHLFSLTDTFK